jgi:gas vesicle protein
MIRFFRFLAGFAMGLVLGSALVSLSAPQSGTETRQRLHIHLQRVLEDAREAAEQTRTEAHSRLAELKARQDER